MTKNGSDPTDPSAMEDIALKVSFGCIATLAVTSNGILMMVLYRNKSMLKAPYNVVILNLGIIDFLTGISISVTPGYILDLDTLPIPGGLAAEIFCRLVYSQYLVFTLGIVSVYTVAFLALERWFAVARPATYKSTFTRLRVYISVASVWIISVLLNTPHLLEIKGTTDENGASICQWFSYIRSEVGRESVALFEFLFKYFIPLFLTFATFYSLRYYTQTSVALSQTNNGKSGRRLLRMSIITAVVLGTCWFPNQFYYLLFKYGVKNVQLGTPVHYFTVTLCMLNSCVNPWIYCATNKSYRRQFARILFPWKRNDVMPFSSNTLMESQEKQNAAARSSVNPIIYIKPKIFLQNTSTVQSTSVLHSTSSVLQIADMDISVLQSAEKEP